MLIPGGRTDVAIVVGLGIVLVMLNRSTRPTARRLVAVGLIGALASVTSHAIIQPAVDKAVR